MVSRIDFSTGPQKAEQVLDVLVSMLSSPTFFNKFITALPITRICLLLLGDKPQPLVACQVLRIIEISIRMSPSFTRKFELISGWTVLKTVLPGCWDVNVNAAAFDVLLGRNPTSKAKVDDNSAVVCQQLIPTILSALQVGLNSVAHRCAIDVELDVIDGSWLAALCCRCIS